MIHRVDELREPPVVGRHYLVPTVRYTHFNMEDDWPVIGPKHTDVEHLNFEPVHYHLDGRFLTREQVRRITDRYREPPRNTLSYSIAALPLNCREWDHKARETRPVEFPPVEYRPLRCMRRAPPYPEDAIRGTPIERLRDVYAGSPIVQTAAGPICPHKGAPLGSIKPDADGVITCPLHGLRFCAKSGRCLGNETPR